MSTFMDTYKRVVVKDISATSTLQIDNLTTLSFYIVERIHETAISSIDYQVEKVSGRATTVLTAWTPVSEIGVEDDIYSFDYLLTGVTTSDHVQIRFKIIDEDGAEYFRTIKSIEIVE